MSIRERGSSFLVDVSMNGKRQRITCATREEAESVNGKLSTFVPTIIEPDGWTLKQAVEQCRSAVWHGKGGERSAVRNAEAAMSFFGENTKLDDIVTDWVDAFIARLKQIGNSNGTVNRKLAALSKVMSYAHRRGKVKARPHFERQLESQGRIRYLTQDEEVQGLAFLSQWSKDDHAEAFCILIDSGVRPSELWRLEERDCNFENGTMAIWIPKNKNPRSVPMTQRARQILSRRAELTLKGQRLFPFDNDWMDNTWERLRHAMGLANDPQFVPYALRHTCASRLVQRGVNLRVVQEWMGHKTITVTMRYAHLSPTNLLEAVKVLEAC